MSNNRYCEMCDKWVSARQIECRACGATTVKAAKQKPVDLMEALRKSLDSLNARLASETEER
jgi:non-homologous end joining protein Ku